MISWMVRAEWFGSRIRSFRPEPTGLAMANSTASAATRSALPFRSLSVTNSQPRVSVPGSKVRVLTTPFFLAVALIDAAV